MASGLATSDGKEVDLNPRGFNLPFGSLDLAVNPEGFTWGGYQLTNFVSLEDFEVRGLRNVYRTAGIGAPLSARVEPSPGSPANRWISPSAKVPITAFVRFENPRLAMSNGHVHGTVELCDAEVTSAIQVEGQTVPLETDPSAALAYRLEGSPVWDFEIAGFREGDFSFLGNREGGDSGLYMLHPYQPGRYPWF